eukprot:jgi/Botrbrau1/3403/Bobra.0337s0039.1
MNFAFLGCREAVRGAMWWWQSQNISMWCCRRLYLFRLERRPEQVLELDPAAPMLHAMSPLFSGAAPAEEGDTSTRRAGAGDNGSSRGRCTITRSCSPCLQILSVYGAGRDRGQSRGSQFGARARQTTRIQ